MMRKAKAAVLAAAVLSAGGLHAQEMRSLLKPSVGAEASATVGSTVFERSRYRVLPAVEIDAPVKAKIIFAEVDLPAGTPLMKINSKTKFKACAASTIEAFRAELYAGCLMDDDGDGKFDRVAGNNVQGGKKLPVPVAYKPSEFIDADPKNIKQVVIYLGSTKDTLRLSYREFINDMARPAFTEEYTFPLAATFPQWVAFKDVKLNVTGIDGAGLHYKVDE